MTEEHFLKPIPEDQKEEFYSDITIGLVVFNKGNHENTLKHFNDLVGKWSEQPEIVFCLGVVSYEFNRRGHAINLFERAHKLDPNCKDYADALAFAYTKHGKLADGLYYAKLTLTLDPHPHFKPLCPAKLSNYTGALQSASPSNSYLNAFKAFYSGKYKEALDLCNMELQINPRHDDCMQLLARIQHKTGHHFKAVQTLRALSHVRFNDETDQALLAEALVYSGYFDQARTLANKLANKHWSSPSVYSILKTVLPLLGENKKLKSISAKWEKKFSITREDKPGFSFDPAANRRIRIGFLCDFAYNCKEAELLDPILRKIDKTRFETILYTTNVNSDNATKSLLHHATEHRAIESIDGYTASIMISGDTIDILIDCTLQPNENHFEIMAERPSPVQIAWHGSISPVGYIGTDYILSDAVTNSLDEKHLHSQQKAVLMRSGLFSHPGFAQYPNVEIHENVNDGHVVYGAQLDPARITCDVISDWVKILQANEKSLLLFGNATNVCHETRTALISQFGNYGVADRIRFQEYEEKDFSKICTLLSKSFFTNIDIMLDTPLVSGYFETMEALWMGIPVISLRGNTHESCLASSVLNSANHFEWSAKTRPEYIRKAISLGKDGKALVQLREKLREELKKSALFSTSNFMRELENAFLTIIHRG